MKTPSPKELRFLTRIGKTPTIIKQYINKMGQHIKESETRLADLKAQQHGLLEKN